MLKQAVFQLSVLFLLARSTLMGARLFSRAVALQVYLQSTRGAREFLRHAALNLQNHPKLRAGT